MITEQETQSNPKVIRLNDLIPRPAGKSTAVKLALIDPATAADWLEQYTWTDQRDWDKSRLETLVHALLNDEWEPTAISVYTCETAPVTALSNGHHRLKSIVLAEKPGELAIIRRWVPTPDDLALAYGRHDPFPARSLAARLKGMGTHRALGLDLKDTVAVVQALKVMMNGFVSKAPSGGATWEMKNAEFLDRAAKMWRDPARAFFAAIEGAIPIDRKHLIKQTILPIGLENFETRPEQAEEFWKQVALTDGVKAHTGPWWLSKLASDLDAREVHRSTRRVASFWNAFFEGNRELDRPGPVYVDLPIRIAGSARWTGKKVHRLDLMG